MKRTIGLFLFAAAALVTLSCSKEMNGGLVPEDGTLVFRAVIEPAEASRSAVDLNSGSVLWEAGDGIYVSDGTNSETVILEAQDIDGKSAVIRTKTISGTASEYYAYYPADNVSAFDASSGTFLLKAPAEFTSRNTKSAVAVSASKEFSFKHVGCSIAFSCTDPSVKAVSFIGMNDENYMPSTYRVAADGTATVSDVSASRVNPAVKVVEGNNYIDLLPTTFSNGFFVSVTDAGGNELGRIVYKKAFEAGRNTVVDLGDIASYTTQKADEFIRNAADLTAFLENAPSRSATYKAMIISDIDMAGKAVVPATYAGILEGKNFKISNLHCDAALFSTLSGTVQNIVFDNCTAVKCLLADINKGTVCNVDVNDNCTLEFKGSSTGEAKFAFIAGYCNASTSSVKDCDVNGKIILSPVSTEKIWLGGVVGSQTTGKIDNCTFGGSIDVTLEKGGNSCTSIGGVIGRSGHTSTPSSVNVSNCKNTGRVSYTHTGANMGKCSVGGVLGQTVSVADATNLYGVLDACVNSGEVTVDYSAGGAVEAFPALGGVAGLVEGSIRNSSNSGSIVFKGPAVESVTPVPSANVGGVSGYVTGDASSCHNYGDIRVTGYFENRPLYKSDGTTATSTQSRGNSDYSCFGGVFGEAGPYTHDGTGTTVLENCTNAGTLDFRPKMSSASTTKPYFCTGGIAAVSTSIVRNCVNKGNMTVVSQVAKSYDGGVVGITACTVEGCDNNADLTVDADGANAGSGSFQRYVGGVVGLTELTGLNIVSCNNTKTVRLCNVKKGQTAFSYIGGVFGVYDTGSVTLDNCTNSGAVTADTDTPVRVGGIVSAIVGSALDCRNSGTVSLVNSSTLVSGKESALGGIAAYSKASFSKCSSTGNVSTCLEGSFAAAFVGSVSPSSFIWSECSADATVSGTSVKASVAGSFTSGTGAVINWNKSTVGSKCSSLPLYASAGPKAGSTNKVVNSDLTGKFRIMSFNIRHTNGGANPTDKGDRNWKNRRASVFAMLRDTRPDILGLCEYTNSKNEDWQTQAMSDDLEDAIIGDATFPVKYARAYVGAAKGIYYNKDKFTFTSGNSGVFYHSDTPTVSSQWPGLSSKRTTAWAKFTEKSSGRTVVFFMSHPDWNPSDLTLKKKASQLNVDMMNQKASADDVQIIAGDMNTLRDTEWDYMTPYVNAGLTDAHRAAGVFDTSMTFNDWGGGGKQDIDYIFTRNIPTLVSCTTINSPNYGVTYISDHWPLLLECTF